MNLSFKYFLNGWVFSDHSVFKFEEFTTKAIWFSSIAFLVNHILPVVLCSFLWIIPFSVSISFLFISHYSMVWFIATVSKDILCALVLKRLDGHTSHCESRCQVIHQCRACFSSILFQHGLVIFFNTPTQLHDLIRRTLRSAHVKTNDEWKTNCIKLILIWSRTRSIFSIECATQV